MRGHTTCRRPLTNSYDPPRYLLRHLERIFTNGFYDIFKEDFRGKSMPVVHNWLLVLPVPTVEFHTTTSLLESIDVSVHAGGTTELVLKEIRVV